MSNEYRITYQDKIFVGDSVEDVVEKVKQYMKKGVEPVDTLKVESKKDSKRIYRIFSEMKSNLFELRYKAEQEWLTEREKNTLPKNSVVCKKCGCVFRCREKSMGDVVVDICDSCLEEKESAFFESECGVKQSSFFQSPYRLKPIGVDEYSESRFWDWHYRKYGILNVHEDEIPEYKNRSIESNEFLRWLADRIFPLIEECKQKIAASDQVENSSLYYDVAKYYCLIDQDEDACKFIQKWIASISLK